MNAFQILPAAVPDYPVCESVIRRSFATVAAQFSLTRENCPTNPAFLPDGALADAARNGDLLYVISAGEKIVGFMQLTAVSNEAVDLAKLCVLPEYRHKGCGAQLLDFAKARAAQMGRSKLTVGIIDANARLKRWYISHGFVQTGARIYSDLPFLVGFLGCPVAASRLW